MGMTRRAIGLMSGTSLDGIDAALLETDGEYRVATGPWITVSYDTALRREMAAFIADVVAADRHGAVLPAIPPGLLATFTDTHADAVEKLIREHSLKPQDIDVIGFHGQTVLHRPDKRFTWQIGDGQALAERLRIDVVNDFRSADVAAGGHGAPLAPLYHKALATSLEDAGPVAVLNVGGVANVTWIGVEPDAVIAFDTGPGNGLIDDWVYSHTGEQHDKDGSYAARGRVDGVVLNVMLEHPYFARVPPKSLDRHDFTLTALAGLALEDGCATLAAFTSAAVAESVEHLPAAPKRWIVCGGGRRNAFLMSRLRQDLRIDVDPAEAVGWDGDAIEAQAFAYLAVRALDGRPLSLPTTTGVPAPQSGGRLHHFR